MPVTPGPAPRPGMSLGANRDAQWENRGGLIYVLFCMSFLTTKKEMTFPSIRPCSFSFLYVSSDYEREEHIVLHSL